MIRRDGKYVSVAFFDTIREICRALNLAQSIYVVYLTMLSVAQRRMMG
jgi:hypothetical protein